MCHNNFSKQLLNVLNACQPEEKCMNNASQKDDIPKERKASVPSSSQTLRMIAERAGCAVSTVSRVINGKRKNFSVRPELEERILLLVREFGYRPNPFLQSMRTRETRIIAIFDPIVGFSDFQQRAKSGFLDKIKEAGYLAVGIYVQLYHVHDYTVPFPVIGSLLFDVSDLSFLEFFEKKAIPYVVLNGLCRENGDSVQVDEAASAHLLLDLLVEKGHRHIVYYGAHRDAQTIGQHYSGLSREQFFCEELAARGLPLPDRDGNALKQAVSFLKHHVLKRKATAVVCYDHVRAEKILHAAWTMGIRIPEQLSVLSFDDHGAMTRTIPPITACKIDGYDLGVAAAKLLLQRIGAREEVCSNIKKIAPLLVLRESVASLSTDNDS